MPPRKAAPSRTAGKRGARETSNLDGGSAQSAPSKSVGKRKMRETPDSEIEIIEGHISPPPKKKSTVPPTQQPIYKLLPGVSLIDRLDAIQGHATPPPETPPHLKCETYFRSCAHGQATSPSPARSNRMKFKTEKLLLLEASKKAKLSKSSVQAEIDAISGDDSDPPPIKKLRIPRASKQPRISNASDNPVSTIA
ncbi:hypothetical protein BD779DRAFT_1674938 [Infundibulicybe gibba]|nr:hypothetical protein BD779DRAFT_1674938 [Infundibulicybe gibba]